MKVCEKPVIIILGCIGLILGAVGVIVPMLPAFPFLLLAAFSLPGSSSLHSWFISTRLYKNNLETYVRGQGMTRRTKHRIIASVTVLILISMSILAICELCWVWVSWSPSGHSTFSILSSAVNVGP